MEHYIINVEVETSNQQSNDETTVFNPTSGSINVHQEAAANCCDLVGEENEDPAYPVRQSEIVANRHEHFDPRINYPNPIYPERQSGWSTLNVPAPMFQVDKRAYLPKIVSIGPFHRNERSVQAMQTQKRRFLNRLFQNQKGRERPIDEEILKNAIRELEEETKNFYAYDFQTKEPDDFVKIMLLDGCFIVELLRFYEKNSEEEPLFQTRWTRKNISRDLLLLENQLPIFVLQKIFELTTYKGETSLIHLALQYFEPLRPGSRENFATTGDLLNHADTCIGKDIKHLLHLFHFALTSRPHGKGYWQQPLKSEKKEAQNLMLPGKGWVHNAKTLDYAGIKLKKTCGSILDIELKGNTLSIPTMTIDGSTGPLLRNLIAYEQNNRDAAPYFCCLAVFLDSIVDTAEDVKILRDASIIRQATGGLDNEVANLFNSLTKEWVFDIDEDDCYMTKEIKNINSFYRLHATRVQARRIAASLNFGRLLQSLFYLMVTISLPLITSYLQKS